MTLDTSKLSFAKLFDRILDCEEMVFQMRPLPPSFHASWVASRFYVINRILQASLGTSALYAITPQAIRARLTGAVVSAFTLPLKLFSPKPKAILLLHERSRGLKDPYLEVIEQWLRDRFGQTGLMYWGDSRCLRNSESFRYDVLSVEALKAAAKFLSSLLYLFYRPAWQREFLDQTFQGLPHADAEQVFAKRSTEAFVLRKLYGLWLDILKPSYLVLTVSYTNIALIQAAKQRGVTVIECQHGLISERHAGYACRIYDCQSKPNHFGLFGPSWQPPMIAESSFVLGVGPRMMPPSPPVERSTSDGSILLISQKSINAHIRELAVRLRQEFPRNRLVIKLHPAEAYDHPYSELDATLATEESFYDLAMRATYVIGFYSTVIFELAQAGIIVNIYPLPGTEMVGAGLQGIYHLNPDHISPINSISDEIDHLPEFFAAPNPEVIDGLLR